MNILGIESSCDETAAAVVKDGREVISSYVLSQIDTHALYGGVVPEIAARAHCEAIFQLTQKAVGDAGGLDNIDAVAVTYAPGLIGALLVGVNFAKSLALAADKPLIPVHHIRGHVAANYITHIKLTPPFVSLIVSGGHSHIVKVSDWCEYKILGRTRDDAAGEAFDKTARILGLGYPGGAKVEAMAKNGNKEALRFPRVNFEDNPFDFSFSGVKTSVINYIHSKEQKQEKYSKEDVAASFTEAVCEVLSTKAAEATLKNNADTLVVAGGVAANSFLRDKLKKDCEKRKLSLFLPELKYCGDNAAMIAAQGFFEYKKGNVAKTDLNAYANMSIENPMF
ncbi:MAG: tRNA (adenosine(37)-N6)-threonylcarbamoyltransferase complex transferase subunit TsaD [Clostridiales bacterium]|nr:tRNA (adenosine(37)-N6)-threonylcarbamoyltransferase complex transferase subunit TsaD [Clostridiales bacterium]